MTHTPPARSLWRTYLVFLGPMVLANLLQSLSGTLNGVYIGQMLGTHALAAVSGMFPVVFFFISLVIGIGSGASVLIGQAWGAREVAKVFGFSESEIAALSATIAGWWSGAVTQLLRQQQALLNSPAAR